MNKLLLVIDEIVQYGLEKSLNATNQEKALEKALAKLYALHFEIEETDDPKDYPDVEAIDYTTIRKNVEAHFQDFGFYKKLEKINDLTDLSSDTILVGDAIDDLSDIIVDLLEVKQRIERNSTADGLWYFDLMFKSHTKQHLTDLLYYLHQKNQQ